MTQAFKDRQQCSQPDLHWEGALSPLWGSEQDAEGLENAGDLPCGTTAPRRYQVSFPRLAGNVQRAGERAGRVSYCLFPCRRGWWLGSVRCAAGGLWAGWPRAACSCCSSCWAAVSWSHRMTVTEWRSCKTKRYYNRNHSISSRAHIQGNTFFCVRQCWATASEITNTWESCS